MPFLGIFSKRDKHKAQDAGTSPSTSAASDFDSSEPDYVLPSAASAQSRSIYAGPPGASSSKLRLGFKSKNSPASRTDTNLLSPPTSNFSSARSESDHDLLSPPPRSAVFAAYDDPTNARSTRSLPTQPVSHPRSNSKDFVDLGSATPSPTVPPKHGKGLFHWAHRERKKSKPTPPPALAPPPPIPDVSGDSDSFNLRSFRHIRPNSPSDSASILPPVRPRPREGSFASDTSQRISVAAFREAHARRSAANSPVPSFSHDALSPGSSAGLRPPSSFVQRASARSPAGNKSNDSSSSDTDESDQDGDSEASSTLKPRRNRTITQRSSKSAVTPGQKSVSELGHRTIRGSPSPAPRIAPSSSTDSSLPPPEPVAKDDMKFSRPRASASASALQPSAAARRASLLVAQQQTQPQQRPSPQTQGQLGVSRASAEKPVPPKPRSVFRRSSSSSSNSSSSSSSSDSDDAPLATLVGPKRPGSAASSAPSSATRSRAQSRVPSKPLIDISTIATSPPLRAQHNQPSVPPKESPVDDRKSIMSWREKEKQASPPPTTPTHASKPSLNDRLARLAKGTPSPLLDISAEKDAQEGEHVRGRERKIPTRSQTQPPEMYSQSRPSPSPSPSPIPPKKPNGRSMSSPNATFEDVKLPDAKPAAEVPPIMPTPIRTRTPPPAFAVTSRPSSQFSLLSSTTQSQAQTRQDQGPTHPRASEETVRTSRARASTLVIDGDLARNKGFTGGGLLAAAAAGSSSSLSANSAQSGQSTGSGSAARVTRQRASTMFTSTPAPSFSPSSSSPLGSPADARFKSNVRGVPQQPDTPPHDLPPPRLVTRVESPESRSAASTASSPATSRPSPMLKSAMKRSPQPSPTPESSTQVPRTRTSSLAAFSNFATPPKPFAGAGSGFGLRGNSPASSTGDSSSGRTPITPVDGSDISATTSSAVSAQKRGHRKSASVTFEEPERGRHGARDREAEKSEGSDPEERRRRERRRSEAKAAIELGKIVNGRGPIQTDDDDEGAGMENMGPRMSMFNSMMPTGMGTMGPVNVTPPTPMGFTPQTPQSMFNPAGNFMFPPMMPPNADPAFLAAHQQAMLAAKQAFQIAVAQQALAAANEEWERGSTATSAFGGFNGMGGMGGMGGGMFPGATPGFPMNMGMGLGMGPWPNPMMFASSQSMYAGSVIGGSELGVNTGGRGAGWGSRSAYGEPSGYAGSPGDRASMAFRNSQLLGGGGYASGARSEIGGPTSGRGGQRARTRTSPSDAPLPTQHVKRRDGPPPSSWNARTNRPA
ncbi:hypothetical protein C8Q73DRAFT_795850 [Cubamyces lactineus]|nr:hypothetical protein C8Q73DRAFT_795850 [Cubamyces lactineus]